MLENQRKKQNSIRSSSEQEPNETAKPGNGGLSATVPTDCLLQYRGQSAVQKSETRLREMILFSVCAARTDSPHLRAGQSVGTDTKQRQMHRNKPNSRTVRGQCPDCLRIVNQQEQSVEKIATHSKSPSLWPNQNQLSPNLD